MRRRLSKPAESPRAASGSGLASLTLPVIAPPAGLLVDERPVEEHRRTQELRLSGQCRLLRTPPPSGERQTDGTAWPGAAGAERMPPGGGLRVRTVGVSPLVVKCRQMVPSGWALAAPNAGQRGPG